MAFSLKIRSLLAGFFLVALFSPFNVHADDWIEKAGVGLGVSIGNTIYVPFKAALLTMVLPLSLIAVVTSGGDTEVARQILHNGIEKPYLITPDIARTAIGTRPELEAQRDKARGSSQ